MSNRVKGCIVGAALVAVVGVPLTAAAQAAPPAQTAPPEQAPPPEQAAPPEQAQPAAAAAATARGELVNVNVQAKTLTIKADGRDMQFSFTDDTKITGANSPAGLATMEGSDVTVRYTTKERVQTATDIQISPKKK